MGSMVKQLNGNNRYTSFVKLDDTAYCSTLLTLSTSLSLQIWEEWKQNKATARIMATEDSGSKRKNKAWTLFCLPVSNYGREGRRTFVLFHPLVLFVGLILLASLPFGASIKQSVPRVKLSYRGRKLNIVHMSVNFIVIAYFLLSYLNLCFIQVKQCKIKLS